MTISICRWSPASFSPPFAVETTPNHVDDALDVAAAIALCGGTALYLLGHIAFLYRATRNLFRRRTVAAVILLALIPATMSIPSVAALGLVSVVCSLVVAYEAVHHRVGRRQLRHRELPD